MGRFNALATLWAAAVFAAGPQVPPHCRLLGQISPSRTRAAATRRVPDAVDEMASLEQTANLKKFEQPTDPQELSYSDVRADGVLVDATSDISPMLRDFFVGRQTVRWPKHPWNSSAKVPFLGAPESGQMTAQFTASRSMIFRLADGTVYSVKLPTNNVHRGETRTVKADNAEDAAWSVATTRLIDGIDAKLKPDPELLILRDVMSVSEKKEGNGFVVRDLTPLLKSGNRYLPAFSLPFRGHQFSKEASFAEYWKKHYAEPVGRMKAKLLLRYGLQLSTPHAQNLLIELTPEGIPTGRIVVRDIVDSRYVKGISETVVGQKAVEESRPHTELATETELSFWEMDKEGVNRITPVVERDWRIAHDTAYLTELGIALSRRFVDIADADRFLKSPEGKAALVKYQTNTKR